LQAFSGFSQHRRVHTVGSLSISLSPFEAKPTATMPPSTRRSIGVSALQPLSANVPPPTTPGKQVKTLKAELEKKDAENEALRSSIANLTNALTSLNIVKEKISIETTDGNNITNSKNVNDDVSTSGRSKNNKKDKDAPVPAKTAYKFFCETNATTPKQDGVVVDMRQVWKECTQEMRQPFVTVAEADKARYLQEFAVYEEQKVALEMYYSKKKEDMAMAYFEAHLTAQTAIEKAATDTDKKGKKKVKKDPEAPKRPTSSYMYFAIDKRESVTKMKKHASAPPTEIMKILGEMWSKLDKGKAGKNGTKKYDDLAATDKARYESEKADYDAMIAERNTQSKQEKSDRLEQDKEEAMKLMKSIQDANASAAAVTSDAMKTNMVATSTMDDMSVVSGLTAKSKTKKVKDPNAPKKASTAYIFFCTENRALIKSTMPEQTTQTVLLTEVGRQWKELTEQKKEKYVTMSNTDKERYAKEMVKYNAKKPQE
jgi:hypothetical protein